ncbi:MAG TPA: hypothetical protein VNJ08_12120 [Bacteriovoracaceae bacterium]|nr:hypothetical protein [Bacteriovoracaceae bacterium]
MAHAGADGGTGGTTGGAHSDPEEKAKNDKAAAEKQLAAETAAKNDASKSPEIAKDAAAAAAYDNSSQSGEGGYDFYMKQIMLIGVNIIGGNILVACPKGLLMPSIAMFEAASIIYIASELLAAKAIGEKHKKSMDNLEMDQAKMAKEGTDLQKQALIQARISEEQTLDYLENKRNWAIALTVMYTAATAAAVAEQIVAFTAAHKTAILACVPLVAVSCNVANATGACPTEEAARCYMSSYLGFVNAQLQPWVPLGYPIAVTYCPGALNYEPACLAAASSYLSLAHAACSPAGLTASLPLNLGLNALILGAWGAALAFGTENGDVAKWGILLTALAGIIPPLNAFLITAYAYPLQRAITFMVADILAFTITMGLDERIGYAKENIKKIQAVLDNFKDTTAKDDVKAVAEGTKAAATGGGSDSNGPDYTVPGGPPTKGSGGSCLSRGGGKPSFGPQACATPVKVGAPQMNFGPGTEALNQVAANGAKIASDLAAGNTQGALAARADLLSKAGRIKAIAAAMKKKLNDQLKAQGKKPIDFDGDAKKQLAQYQGIANQAAAAKGISPSGGGAKLDPLASESPSGPTMVGKAGGGATGAANPMLGMDTLPAETGITSSITAPTEKLDSFETAESDINANSGVSLFSLISNRYVHSYGKVMNKKEVPEAVPKKGIKAPK